MLAAELIEWAEQNGGRRRAKCRNVKTRKDKTNISEIYRAKNERGKKKTKMRKNVKDDGQENNL